MQVTSATSADRSSALTADPATAAVAGKKTALNSNDFMKLLSVQFQNQDPMKPMEDTAFIAQMAQFSSLEQNTSMATQLTQLSASQQVTAANSYLGNTVTVDDGQGGTATGQVTGIEMASGTPRLVVGDYTYPVSAVLLVEPAATHLPPAA
jgi:flagellar basal-body rod modification protein FlgD